MDVVHSNGKNQHENNGEASLPKLPVGTPLSQLATGASAVVLEVLGGPPGGRCMEMGLIPGARVEVLQAGDPMLLGIGGGRLAMSRNCLTHILVETVRE